MVSRTRPIGRVVGALAVLAVVGGGATACGGDNSTEAPAPAPATQPGATNPTTETSPSATSSSAPSSSASSPSPSASSSASPSGSSSPTAGGNQQTAVALQAIATAQQEVDGGKVFDLEDDTERGQRVWSAKVATADDRQFNLAISQDGANVTSNDEDKTPDDDIRKLKAAKVSLKDAINTAVGRAKGEGDLTSLEIDTDDNKTVVWQVEFGGDNGTTVLLDATSGKVLDVGPDAG